ncbi:MAG: PEP-CTERM sorting domain-containing protein [Nitrospirae bacterium]|nr:PEP-CTERM sorting domain-containing protein [Nitrospirota bacterium]
MKKICLFLVLVTIVVLILPETGKATVVNPYPAFFADDDGSELFVPNSTVLSVEGYDYAGSLGFPSYFGFFYNSAPLDPIVIFGQEDQGSTQAARIDFDNGVVYDVDDSNSVQSTFTVEGNPIGFFLWFDPTPYGSPLFLTTVPSFNPGKFDFAGTFPYLNNPSNYGIIFELPNGTPLSLHLVGGLTAVPEPSTLFLLGSGLIGLAAYGKKRSRKKV